jgi:hypothetical protein
MSTYIEYEIEEGVTILIEAPESETGGIVKAARPGEATVAKAKKTFQQALAGAKAQAKLLLKEIDDLQVSEAEIKFGLTTTGELGNLAIGKIGLDVNYEVTLKWKKPEVSE